MNRPQLLLGNMISPEVMDSPPPAYIDQMYAATPRKVWRMFSGDVLISPHAVPKHMLTYACDVLGMAAETLEIFTARGNVPLLSDRILYDAQLLKQIRASCAARPGIGLEPFVLDSYAISLADHLHIPLQRYMEFAGRPNAQALQAVHQYNAKAEFREWAAGSGSNVLPGILAKRPKDLLGAARRLDVPAFIVKLNRGSSGFGHRIFSGDTAGLLALEKWADSLVHHPDGYVVEEALAVTSSPSAEFELLDDETRLISVCDQRCVDNAWVGMTIPPFDLSEHVQSAFIQCGRRFGEHLRSLGYRGYFDIDGVYDGTRFAVTETNLRTSGGSHMDVILRRLCGDSYTVHRRVIADSVALRLTAPFAHALERIRAAGLTIEEPGQTGVVITADGADTDGKVRYMCIGESAAEALNLEIALRRALRAPNCGED